jgi:hypothetical protein
MLGPLLFLLPVFRAVPFARNHKSGFGKWQRFVFAGSFWTVLLKSELLSRVVSSIDLLVMTFSLLESLHIAFQTC